MLDSPTESSAVPVLQGRGLVRAFGPARAVDGVDVSLDPGSCLALFGPNGAGKTTLLRMLAGLLRPTAGEVRISGVAVRSEDGAAARGRIGLISHQSMLYSALTALENVEFAARLHGVPDARSAAERALEKLRVLNRAQVPVRALSRGLQQRVSIARAIVHGPDVLLLDEPYTGLDEPGARALTHELNVLRGGGAAMVLVTHNLAEGLALATQTAVMQRGRFTRTDLRESLDVARYAAEYGELVAHEH